MPKTYEPIASTTLANDTTTNVTFNSITQNYTDLIFVFAGQAASANGNYLYIQYNNDTASNYSTNNLAANGSSVSAGRFNNRTNFNIDLYATPINGTINNRIVQIMNYSNTTTNKIGVSRSNRANAGTDATIGVWRSTAAITSIKITIDQNFFASGSSFSIYGIKAA
jgi:hypothetical protein